MAAFPPLRRSLHCPSPSPSCQTQTAHLPFPDSYLPTLLKLIPAHLPDTRHWLSHSGSQWQLGGREEPLHSHYLPWTNQKGYLACSGVFDHWPLDFDSHMGSCLSKITSKTLFSSFLSCLKTPFSTAAFIKDYSSAFFDSGQPYSHVWPKSSSYFLMHP